MRPPPIRYPLPMLILVIAVGLLAWRGAAWTRPVWSALKTRWERVVEGPPVPSSAEPQAVAGPIVRRVLLLHEETPAASRPGGKTSEIIRQRMFADVYDVWPLKGTPTHYRIGNQRAIGWVSAADVLPWSTRLVVRAPSGQLALAEGPGGATGTPVEVGDVPLPVLDWQGGSVRVAAWDREAPWARIERTGWVGLDELPAEAWGVLLSRVEVLKLIRLADNSQGPARQEVRLRAVSGRLVDAPVIDRAGLEAARAALPPVAFAPNQTASTTEPLAELNAQWSPDASWGGLTFQFVPLADLP